MRALLAAAAMVALTVAPAYAQKKAPPPSPAQQAAEREKQKAEDAYQAALKNTAAPGAAHQADNDPWANARTPATKGK